MQSFAEIVNNKISQLKAYKVEFFFCDKVLDWHWKDRSKYAFFAHDN